MKRKVLKIIAFFLILMISSPVHAFGILNRTSSDEYYLWLYKDGRETYEGRTVTARMFEDAGFSTESVYESDLNKKLITSSSEKILSTYGPIITCNKVGDVKVTIYGDKGTKVNKIHVFDLKLNLVTRNSKKITLKARGNLKGCKAIVRIGGKTYKKKITKKNQKITFKIPKMATGRKIRVKLVKGKKELLTYGSCVYYDVMIKKGMSKKNAKNTLEYAMVGYEIRKSGNKEIWDCPSYEKITLKNNQVEKVVRKRKIALY